MSNRRLVPLNVVSLPTAPAGVARPGDVYHNSVDGNLYVSNGTVWTSLGGADGPYGSGDFAADFAQRDTDDLTEGTSNLYFTVARARSATAGVYDPAGSAANAEAAANAYTDAAIADFDALPEQTGNAGKYLTTNGTSTSWGSITTEASKFVVASAPPPSPVMGSCYFDSTLLSLRVYDGAEWASAGSLAGSVDGGRSDSVYVTSLDGGTSST